MVYRISIGSKIIFSLLAIGALIGGAYLLRHSTDGSAGLVWRVLGLLFLIGGVGGFWAIFRIRMTVEEGVLTMNGLFSSKTVALNDIDGYREGTRQEFWLVRKDSRLSITIPFGLEKRRQLIGWIKQRYEDVDLREHDREMNALLDDQRLGVTREDREQRLKTAKGLGSIALIAGFVLFFAVIFCPRPLEWVMYAELAAPWVGVLATVWFAGMMKMSMSKRSAYPSMLLLVLFPVAGGAIAALRWYKIYAFPQSAWSALIVGALLVSIMVATLCRRAIGLERRKAVLLFSILVVSAIYCWSVLVHINCFYDRSVPVGVQVAVEGKQYTTGRGTSYFLTTSPWGRFSSGKKVEVSHSFYKSVSPGDSIRINMQAGHWGIPWYWIEK